MPYGHPDINPLTGARPLPDDQAGALLTQVVEQAARAAGALVAFDLDSTLLDNRPRQARIMREYGQSVGHAALAAAGAGHWQGWDARIAMRNAGLDETEVERHFAGFRAYWLERFFTSEYCIDDRPIPGASEYVRAVLGTGATVLYVTGRHEAMRRGTVESFCNPRFPDPDGERVQLLMKPTLDEHDDAYKERTFARLRSLGAVVAAFDNEPAHINGYRDAFPEAICVHLATDHSLREIKVADGIPSIRDFTAYGS
jgi:hypothetical protein